MGEGNRRGHDRAFWRLATQDEERPGSLESTRLMMNIRTEGLIRSVMELETDRGGEVGVLG